MTEMLLQSQWNEIHLLPALPSAWVNGEVKGLKARGAFEVNIKWINGKLQQSEIKSLNGSVCSIRSSSPFKVKGASAKVEQKNGYYVTSFPTQKGNTYTLSSE